MWVFLFVSCLFVSFFLLRSEHKSPILLNNSAKTERKYNMSETVVTWSYHDPSICHEINSSTNNAWKETCLPSTLWVQLLIADGQVQLMRIGDTLGKGFWIYKGEEKLEKALADVIQHSPQ